MKEQVTFNYCDELLGDKAPFLRSLSDNPAAELTIEIERAVIGNVMGKRKWFPDSIGAILEKSRPVTADESVRITIQFPRYILYQVRDESWSAWDPRGVWEGKYLRIFSESGLLQRIETETTVCRDGDSYLPGKWRHYGIYTQNHVVDVISHIEPVMTIEKF